MMICMSMLDTEDEKSRFILLYEQYAHMMWYVANDVLHDSQLAEDAVQEAFIALTRHMDRVQDINGAYTKRFLYTIVRSKAIDIYRRRSIRAHINIEEVGEPADDEADILDNYISEEGYDNIVSCIRKLKDDYRIVMELRILHELSEEETAQILGITKKLVGVRLHRARRKLQELLLEGEQV